MENLAIIIPAYNEEKTIEITIGEFAAVVRLSALIVVVDNASEDDTAKYAQEAFDKFNCRGVVIPESKKGKALAIKSALSHVQAQIYVVVDADCTYPASQLYELIEPIKIGEADMVVGNRFSQGDYLKISSRPLHGWGNQAINYLVRLLFNGNLHDILSGYRAFSSYFIKDLLIKSSGFEVETEITIYALIKRFSIREIPIGYRNRPCGSYSKLSTFKDGLKIIFLIMRSFGACVLQRIYKRHITYSA